MPAPQATTDTVLTVYNKDGYFTPDPQNHYSFNSVTAERDADGAATFQFGGRDGDAPNCLHHARLELHGSQPI
jgi:hypothetical protein